jgi:predicted nucleic acid-binding protein
VDNSSKRSTGSKLTRTRRKVFIDSSALFAASYSPTGSAHELVERALEGRVGVVLSTLVLTETERNLVTSAPHALHSFLEFRDILRYRLRNPSPGLILDTERIVVAKDAPIIAAARSARVKLVATYDRKHLLSIRADILEAFGITVATPDEILTTLRLR